MAVSTKAPAPSSVPPAAPKESEVAKDTAPSAPEAPAPQTMVLELTGAKRFVPPEGGLFVADVAYTFPMGRGLKALELTTDGTDEGKRVFSIYKEKKVVVPEAPKPVSAPAARSQLPQLKAPTANTNAPAPIESAPIAKSISLTTPEEEAELGLPPLDEAPTAI